MLFTDIGFIKKR